jgi:hypothetical protein
MDYDRKCVIEGAKGSEKLPYFFHLNEILK